ncbi:MAG: glutathione S-transferase family protein [Acidimicrobiales bacterium]|nr:glutathione S-transferase family protein [Acidimicrobiales bacterium]MDG1876183.1 glutathione S-transferase family protein [Acidimicrobiales bacterium]
MSADVALFGHWICPFSTRVEWALHQRGIGHELVSVPPSAARPNDFVIPQEFIDHSPKLEVPMVRVGHEYLAESIPVLEWLEERIDAPSLLPLDLPARELVRERVAWIDQNAFRPMVGVYYGVERDRIERAGQKLVAALDIMGGWANETAWLAGTEASLAEAVAMPIHVRLAGLQRLGLTAPIPSSWAAHGERCRELLGWDAVEWTQEQEDEFVGRFEAFRRMQRRK